MNLSFRAQRMPKVRKELASTDRAIPSPPSLSDLARQILEQARCRSHFLPTVIFEDPQWMMMLDLFIAAEEGREVSVTSLGCASGVAATTALRHIRYLQEQGLVERLSHPHDKRVSLVRLAEPVRRQIARYLISMGTRLALEVEQMPNRADP